MCIRDRLFEKLIKKGVLHFATDNIRYAYDARLLLNDYFHSKQNILFSDNRGHRPITKYEEKALLKKSIILLSHLIVQKIVMY